MNFNFPRLPRLPKLPRILPDVEGYMVEHTWARVLAAGVSHALYVAALRATGIAIERRNNTLRIIPTGLPTMRCGCLDGKPCDGHHDDEPCCDEFRLG